MEDLLPIAQGNRERWTGKGTEEHLEKTWRNPGPVPSSKGREGLRCSLQSLPQSGWGSPGVKIDEPEAPAAGILLQVRWQPVPEGKKLCMTLSLPSDFQSVKATLRTHLVWKVIRLPASSPLNLGLLLPDASQTGGLGLLATSLAL